MSIRIVASHYCSSIARVARSQRGISGGSFPKRGAPASLRPRGKSSLAADVPEATSGGTGAAGVPSASSESVPVGATLVAMALAIGTVGAGAFFAESATASTVPAFDPKGERFDQSTFVGRFSKMLLGCDPFLLVHEGEEVRRCKAMVDDYENHLKNLPGGVSETDMSRKLWEAQRIASAALHPDTGDSIPQPFRMSGYVPYNGPICVAMVASQSTSLLLFWSWANQSHNALVNYYNRNAASEMTNETLAKSYAGAVGSALAVAFGLATFIQRRYSPARAKELLRWVAFPSAVVASSLNCYIVRSPEIGTGVPLVDADGVDVLPGETSKVAARRGVNSTTFSRALLSAPVYFLPPFFMGAVPALRNAILRNPMMRVPMTTYLLLVCFGIGLPATIAVFPQMGEINVEEAEEKYWNLKNEKSGGKPYEVLYYNKGL